MNKFLNLVKIFVLVGFLYSSSICMAQKRFDFEIHYDHFLAGEYKSLEREFKNCLECKIIFKDGCAVKYNSSKITGRTYNWRWVKRNIHGKLM